MECVQNGADIVETVKKQLECSVCLELSTSQIFMCPNGHNVCSSCQPQIAACPVCRHPGRPLIRNRLAEELAQSAIVPCKNSEKGCNETMIAKDMKSHLVICSFNIESHFECCSWQDSIANLGEHARKCHLKNFIEVRERGVVFKLRNVASHDAMLSIKNQLPQNQAVCYQQLKPSNLQNAHNYVGQVRYSSSMLMFHNHLFWYHTVVSDKMKFRVQLEHIGPIGEENGLTFYYALEFLCGANAKLIYYNFVRESKTEICSDEVLGDELEGCFNSQTGCILYSLKLFEGTSKIVGMTVNGLPLGAVQLRSSKPETWV